MEDYLGPIQSKEERAIEAALRRIRAAERRAEREKRRVPVRSARPQPPSGDSGRV